MTKQSPSFRRKPASRNIEVSKLVARFGIGVPREIKQFDAIWTLPPGFRPAPE